VKNLPKYLAFTAKKKIETSIFIDIKPRALVT
jgi:hypothetical protein